MLALCFLVLLLLLFHRASDVVHLLLSHTPPDPNQLSIYYFGRPALLETRSQQGLTSNSLHFRGREPLRSAFRLLGFDVESCLLGSWPRACGGSSPQTPLRDIYGLPRGHGCRSRNKQGHLVGSPLHWASAGTGISDAV